MTDLLPRLLGRRWNRHDDDSGSGIQRLLIIQLAGLGDLIMLTPFIRHVRESLPKVRLDMLVSSRAARVLDNNPHVDRVFSVDGWMPGLSCARRLQSERYDVALNAYSFRSRRGELAMALLMGATGARRLAGRSYGDWGRFLDIDVPETANPPIHKVRWPYAIAPRLGLPEVETPGPLEVFPGDEHRTAAHRFAAGVARPIVCLHPWSFRPTRRWPLGRFLELARTLEDRGLHAAFTAASSDPPEVRSRLGESGYPLFVSRSPLELAALYRQADCAVVADTGPIHIAAASQLSTVALVGPSDLAETMPWNPALTVLRHEVDCSPCYHFDCPQKIHCMELIETTEVADAVAGRVRLGDR